MPVTINEVESRVEVLPPGEGGEAPSPDVTARIVQIWLELARRQQRNEARTAAWGFDD